jgi:hypothetical protein
MVVKRIKVSDKEMRGKNRQPANSRKGKVTQRNQASAHPSTTAVELSAKAPSQRPETPQSWSERKRLFLGVGDEVTHLRYDEWGIGVVMEVMTSSVPGGTCLARIRFQDGQLRCFNNDLDNETCCYYFGVRRYWNPSHGVNAARARFFAFKD